MDTLQQVPPCGSLSLATHLPLPATFRVRLQCVTFGLIIFGCKMSAKVKAKLTFLATCVCLLSICVCGSNFIIGFPSAIKILRIFKSIYSSAVPCPAFGLGESNEKQWQSCRPSWHLSFFLAPKPSWPRPMEAKHGRWFSVTNCSLVNWARLQSLHSEVLTIERTWNGYEYEVINTTFYIFSTNGNLSK